jgi:hypothetical protein
VVDVRTLGYVLIEWNQASLRPSIASDELYSNRADAIEDARTCQDEATKVGRRERYSVAEVSEDWS